MGTRIKSGILLATFLFGFGIVFAQVLNKKSKDEPTEEVNKVAEYKAKTREKLKPHKYDGSKVTYFNYLQYEQKKKIEVLLFNGIEYKFCFNSEGVPKGIGVHIYDKDEAAKDRVVIYEASNVIGKDFTITSDEMLKNLQSKKSGVTSIKRVYIEYSIPATDQAYKAPVVATEKSKKEAEASTSEPQQKGVIVLSYGYKNV